MTNYREQQRAGGYVRDPAQPAEDAPYPHDELATLRAQRDELLAALDELVAEWDANHADEDNRTGYTPDTGGIALARAAIRRARGEG